MWCLTAVLDPADDEHMVFDYVNTHTSGTRFRIFSANLLSLEHSCGHFSMSQVTNTYRSSSHVRMHHMMRILV